MMNNRIVGIFFTINNSKYVTMVDYRSKNRFKKLLEEYTKNAKIYIPQHNEKFKFVDLNLILETAYKNLETKQQANKLIYALMAQNDIHIYG